MHLRLRAPLAPLLLLLLVEPSTCFTCSNPVRTHCHLGGVKRARPAVAALSELQAIGALNGATLIWGSQHAVINGTHNPNLQNRCRRYESRKFPNELSSSIGLLSRAIACAAITSAALARSIRPSCSQTTLPTRA